MTILEWLIDALGHGTTARRDTTVDMLVEDSKCVHEAKDQAIAEWRETQARLCQQGVFPIADTMLPRNHRNGRS